MGVMIKFLISLSIVWAFAKGQGNPDPTEAPSDQSSAQQTAAEAFEAAYNSAKQECTTKEGLFTSAACYFLSAKDQYPMTWERAFEVCSADDPHSVPAHVYDMSLLTHLREWLRAPLEHDIVGGTTDDYSVGVWLGGKHDGSTNMVLKWMNSSTEALGDMTLSEEDGQQYRVAVEGPAPFCLTAVLDIISGVSFKWATCDISQTGNKLSFGQFGTLKADVYRALCMKYSSVAQFKTVSNKKITSQQTQAVTVEDMWFCGLACRRRRGCVAANFETASGQCFLLPAKPTDATRFPGYYLIDHVGWTVLYRQDSPVN